MSFFINNEIEITKRAYKNGERPKGKSILLKEYERLLYKKEEAELGLKEKSCIIDRLKNKEEELKLEKSILLKENESFRILTDC